MSVFNKTFSRALKVIPSDYCDVPSPHLLIKSNNTNYDSGNPNRLIDSNIKFFEVASSESTASQNNLQYLVNVGDVVYCYQTNKAATILEVVSDTILLLNDDIFLGDSGYTYFIYQQGPTTGLGNRGAFLYLAGGNNMGDLHVTTIGGENITVVNVSKPFFPIQVQKVWFEGTNSLTDDIFAVW